jgi:hypothetical protein
MNPLTNAPILISKAESIPYFVAYPSLFNQYFGELAKISPHVPKLLMNQVLSS